MKQIAKRILPLLPPVLQTLLRKEAERRRQIEKQARKERVSITRGDVEQALAQLRFDSDVILHSSISNIGKFELPVQEIAALLAQTIDISRHTLLVPALPFNSSMREHLDKAEVFDVRSARNAMGAIPNILMAYPGAKRSIHPTHSVVALGPEAWFYVDSHEADATPFGPNSPFFKLTKRRGKILMFGVGLNSVTNFHVYEDLLGPALPFEVYLDRKYVTKCVGRDGAEIIVESPCHNPQLSSRRECERARSYLQSSGAISTIPFGESEISLIDAHLFTVTLLEMLLAGKSIYGEITISPEQRHAVQNALRDISCA